MNSYEPIDCSLHDELEARATKGAPSLIRFRGEKHDGTQEVTDRIVDVFTRGDEEFIRLSSNEEIRLDWLEAVDGVRFGDADDR